MKKNILILASFAMVTVLAVIGCKKDDALETAIPGIEAHFTAASGGYSIISPTTTYTIPVGITTTSNVDRQITVAITSPTGAVEGTHYTVDKKVITIPAGKALDSIKVTGAYSLYQAGRKDTLVFTITQPDVAPANFDNKFTLLMRGPCFEGDVDLQELVGTYANTIELNNTSSYGPYTTTVKSFTQAPGATTGTITVGNIWDDGWNDLVLTLDWTDPNNRTVVLTPGTQATGKMVSSVSSNPAYASYGLNVGPLNPPSAGIGTFSVCNQTISFKYRLCFALGCFSNIITENMAR